MEQLTISVATHETESWLGEDSGYALNAVSVSGDEVTVTVEGSGDLPEPDALASSLAVSLESEIRLILEVIPRQTTVVEADPSGAVVDSEP